VARWEPRIELTGVSAQPGPDGAVVHIDVAYRVKATNDHRNLVYPFYVIPREEPAP
jgi:phage baseplate assembly protein W